MGLFFDTVFSILTSSPGNLIYHLLLVLSIAGALQGMVTVMRSSGAPSARRGIIGLCILLALQLIPFLLTPLFWLDILDAQTLLPTLDRAFTLLSLLWIAWLWIFPEPSPRADIATLILTILVVLAFGITFTFWAQSPESSGFNYSLLDRLWQVGTLGFLLLALVVLLIRRPSGLAYALASLLLASVGHLLHYLIYWGSGDFSGVIRLFEMALFPLLLGLPQRIPPPEATQTPARLEPVEHPKADQPFQERRRYSTDPKTFHSLLNLASNMDQVGAGLTRGIAQSMLADLCFLILVDSEKNLSIANGYDLIREETLDGAPIEKADIPLLTNAILRGRALRLPAGNNNADTQGLGKILGLSNPGNAMTIPIEGGGRSGAIGAILLLSPYSNRLWSAEDQAYLTNVSSTIVPILQRNQRMADLSLARDTAMSQLAEMEQTIQELNNRIQPSQDLSELGQSKSEELNQASAEIQSIRKQAQELANENSSLKKSLSDKDAKRKTAEVTALSAELAVLKKSLSDLDAENKRLQASITETTTSGSVGEEHEQMEKQFRMTLEELAHLQNELANANTLIAQLDQKPASASIPDDQVEVIASISQELRQPMSSIIGYTDLLLGESVGILGALQRKFLERVKASTERIGGLIEDLIQITTIETGRVTINPEIIDLNLIIDNAVAYTSTQLREKNITMRLDIPESPPRVHIDKEALQQILIHLLQNAGAATLVEGTVMLRVKIQQEDEKDFLMIQVVDTGGGIQPENLPKVFSRRYRADNVLIQGLGDTGVGLSIAKTLAEAQSGRIWVETTQGVGSTISVLLPIKSVKTEEEE